MKRQLAILLLLGMLFAAAVQARIEAPDHVIYGNATVFGDPVAPGQRIEARLLSTGEVIASYELGFDARLGDQYALRVPMDTVDPRVDGRARPGDPVRILIEDIVAGETTVGAEGTATRLDLDPQNLGTGPSLQITDVEVFEGNAGTTPAVFDITLNTTSESDVIVRWETVDVEAVGGPNCGAGIDYLAGQDELVIPPGEQQGSVTVLVCGDNEIESTETFELAISVINGVPSRPAAVGTIIDDDDVPSLRVADVSVLEPAAGATAQAVFQARLTKNSDFEARFEYQTEPLNAVPGADYETATGSITIPPGELEADIPVEILNAPGTSEPKSFLMRFSDGFNLVIDQNQALGVIEDPAFKPAVEHEQDIVNQQDVVALAAPTALAISPDGAHAYVTSEALDAVLLFSRNAFNGRLRFVETYDIRTAGFENALLDGAIDVRVSPDGAYVYVAAFEDNAIAVFERNEDSGRLGFVQNQIDGQIGAPDAPENSGLEGVRQLLLSVDGAHLYAASARNQTNAVAVFGRDAATGELRFMEAEANGLDDADDAGATVVGMSRPSGLALSSDGDQLYVASRAGDAVQVFERIADADSADYGYLSFVTAYQDGLDGITGLNGAFDIAVTGDNEHVYVSAENENAIVLFDRNIDGTLAQLEVFGRQVPERPGLTGAQGLAVSPDGLEVFATGFADDSLTIFERMRPDNELGATPGDLRVRQTLFDDQGKTLNMAGPTRVTPSADDEYLYVVANQDNAIVVLRRISLDIIFEDDFED